MGTKECMLNPFTRLAIFLRKICLVRYFFGENCDLSALGKNWPSNNVWWNECISHLDKKWADYYCHFEQQLVVFHQQHMFWSWKQFEHNSTQVCIIHTSIALELPHWFDGVCVATSSTVNKSKTNILHTGTKPLSTVIPLVIVARL